MDFHFIVRNGIAGGIFLAMAFVGVWVTSPTDALVYIKNLLDAQSLIVAVVAAATPLLGICLQSLIIAYRYWRRDVFTDDARTIMSERFRQAIDADPQSRNAFGKLLEPDGADRVFVSIYHRSAPAHLIEWARRRRSYNYLGETSVCAVLTGFGMGLISTWLAHFLSELTIVSRFLFVVVTMTVFIFLSLWLAKKMRRDADRMELAWTMYELTPSLLKHMQAGGAAVNRRTTAAPSMREFLLLVVERLLSRG